METRKLQVALVEAQDGLRSVDADFQSLRKRKEQLERLVASLTEVLNASIGIGEGNGVLAQESPAAESVPLDAPQRAVWQLAQDVLTFARKPLSVPDITLAIAAQSGTTVDSETVRVAMYRKAEIFSKTERGKYGLKSWESPSMQSLPETSPTKEMNW